MAKIGSKIWITGGRSGLFSPNKETAVFDTDSNTYKSVQTKGEGPPEGLFASCSIGRGDSFIVFGGSTKQESGFVEKNDIYSLNTETLEWTKVKTTGNAPFIQGHKCVTFGNKMYVFGGISKKTMSTNVYYFDLEKNVWSSVASNMKPRAFFSASTIDQRAYLFGGSNSQYGLDDLLVFNLVTHSWESPTIQGMPSQKQGHCSVGHDGKVYIFGGKSAYSKLTNDVIILDTKPGSSKEEEKDLSSKIQSDIVKFTILIQTPVAPVKIQSELKEILDSDAKEEDLLKGIQSQLKAWDEVETSYNLMTSARSRIHNISSSFDYDIKEIEHLTESVAKRKKALGELVNQLQNSINNLKTKEEVAKVEAQNKKSAKDSLDRAQAAVRSIANEITAGVTRRQQLVHEDGRLKERKVLLENRQRELQKTAEFSQKNAKEFQLKEKELSDDLTKLRENLSKIDVEKEALDKKFEEQNNKLAEVVRQIEKFREMSKAGDSLKDVYENLLKVTENFKKKKQTFATMFHVDGVTVEDEKKQKEDELSFLDKLLNKKDELIKEKAQLLASLESIKAELTRHGELSSNLKGQEAKIKTQLADVSRSLAQVTGDSSSKSSEKEKVDKEWADVFAAIEKVKEDSAELINRAQSLDGKLSQAKAEETKVRSEFDEAQKKQALALKELQGVQTQMESQYAQLHEQLSEYEKENEELGRKGYELEASKLSFTNHRTSVDSNKQKLLAKIKEIDDEKNAQMNKEIASRDAIIEARDKRIKELEQQLEDIKKAEEAKQAAEEKKKEEAAAAEAAKKKADEEAAAQAQAPEASTEPQK